jgi:hypothetical protein
MPDGNAIPGSGEDRERTAARKMAAEMKAADKPMNATPTVTRIRPGIDTGASVRCNESNAASWRVSGSPGQPKGSIEPGKDSADRRFRVERGTAHPVLIMSGNRRVRDKSSIARRCPINAFL